MTAWIRQGNGCRLRGDNDGTNGAPVNLGTSNGGVETEDGHAGGGDRAVDMLGQR